jgi:surface antigen
VRNLFVIAALAGVAAGPVLAASGYAAAKDSVVFKFNADDFALMRAKVRQGLAAEPGSEMLAWKNDATGASGSVAPLDREVWNELPCRQLRIVNTHGSQTAQGVYRFCEKPPGRWKLAGPVLDRR